MQPAISISGLVKNYGKVKALRGLDLAIEPGQLYGLLGPNGAGKSTLIKTLVGAVRPTSGAVKVLGYTMPGEARQARACLGYMPQIPALYEDLSVRANIRFFARAHKPGRLDERLERVLDFVGLSHLAGRRTATLSGGLKQRCSLACALIHEPALLLLDEPTAGVDPVLKEGFWRHFRALADKGMTIVISTHLMDEPLACDRIGILREGRLICEDTPHHILAKGQSRVTIEIDGESFTEEVSDYERELPGLLNRYGLDPGISRISLYQESLEEIFLKLVEEDETHDK